MSQEKKQIVINTVCDATPFEAFQALCDNLAQMPIAAMHGAQLMGLLNKIGEVFGPQVQALVNDLPTDEDGVPHQPGNPKP